jgi:O-antigen/teichoic acid export membrane protein
MSTPATSADSSPAPAKDGAVSAARGVAWVGAAKVLFILSGLAIQLVVPRLLGAPEVYGLLTTATTALAIVTNTLTSTLVQTTSRLVSSATVEERASIERAALKSAGMLGLGVSAIFGALAYPLAHYVLRDPRVAPLLGLGALIIAAYSLYATAIGVLNGRRTFARQARLDATFSVLRAFAWSLGALAGFGALGVMVGFASGAMAVAAVGLLLIWRSAPSAPADFSKRFLNTLLPLAAMQLALNGVLQLDVEVLKSLLAHLAIDAGQSAEDAAELASFHVGCYRGAQQLAFLPYQLSIAVTLVLFPVVAHAKQAGDPEAATRATEGALRFTLLALIAMEAPLVAGGASAMRLLLPDAFAEGADALPVLALGQIAFALFALCATVLAGAGEMARATRAAVIGLCAMLGAGSLGVIAVGVEGPVRVAAAAGSAIGAVVALTLALRSVKHALGARFPFVSLLRGLFAGVLAAAAGSAVVGDGVVRIALAVITALAVYVALLAITRELGRADVAMIRRVLGR